MKLVDRAFFIEGGAAVVTLVSNRIDAHDLSGGATVALASSPRWQAKMSHAIHVVEAPGAGVVICTDTGGRHMAVDARTGEVRWKTKKVGEGHAGLVTTDMTGLAVSGEMFVHVTWKGAMQWLDPVTGVSLGTPQGFDFGIRHPLKDRSGRLWVIRSDRYSDGRPQTRALARLALDPPGLTDVLRIDGSDTGRLSCDGGRLLCVDLIVPDSGLAEGRFERWRIVSVPGGETLASCDMPPGQFSRFDTGWSPDGRWIWTKHEDRIVLLAADGLTTEAEVPCDRYRQPAFHPLGTHLLVCTGRATRIAPLAALVG